MKELQLAELGAVSGGLTLSCNLTSLFGDILNAISMVPTVYDAAVTAAADVMCRATGDC